MTNPEDQQPEAPAASGQTDAPASQAAPEAVSKPTPQNEASADGVPRSESAPQEAADASKPDEPTQPAAEPASEKVEASEGAAKPEAAEGAGSETAEAKGEGEAKPKRKRKRRRRKKKPEGEATGEAGEATGETEGGADKPEETAAGGKGKKAADKRDKDKKSKKGDDKKKKLPFAYLFEAGLAGRKHGYHVGTLVAGHVVLVGEGAAVINLFGKATAFALEHEPRDAPGLAGDDSSATSQAEAPAAKAEAAEAPAAEAPAAEAPAAEAPAAEAPAAEAPAAETSATEAPEAVASPAEVSTEQGQPGVPEGAAPTQKTAAAVEDPPPSPEPADAAELPVPESHAADVPPSVDAADAPASDLGEANEANGADAGEVTQAEDGGAESELGSKSRPEPPVFPELEPLPPLAVGTMFRGRIGAVADSGHIAIVNRNIDVAESRARLKQAMAARSRVQGLVFGYNRGGFDVLVDGIRAFCPLRGITLDEIHDPNPFLGSMFEFLVQQVKSGKQGIVVSRRSILEREAKKRALKRIKSLEVGEVLDVRINSIRKPGVVIEFEGGAEGLVPHSEVSWDRGKRARDVAKIGSVRKAKVIRLPERIGKTKRYSRTEFSFKALDADPWAEHEALLKEGTPAKGKIVSLMDFGAFVELAPGLQGLLHVSELGRGLKHPSDAVSAGEEVFVVVDRVDRDRRQVSLSKLSDAEAELFKKGELVLPEGGRPKLRVGGKVNVVVTKADAKGIVVQVPGVLGKKGRGFIRPGDTGTQRGTDLRKRFKEGKEIEVKIVATDRDGGLRCSIKAVAVDEERQAIRSYKKQAGKQSFGKLGDLFAAELGLGKDDE